MLHGNGGADILFDEPDLIRFYDLLEEGVKRFDVRIYALGLMSSHADGIGGGYREEFHSGTRGRGRIPREGHFAEYTVRSASISDASIPYHQSLMPTRFETSDIEH
jgi:hypothetical protein